MLSRLTQTKLPLPAARVGRGIHRTLDLLGVRAYRLSVVFVPDDLMRRLNRRYTGHRGVTDVLAFDLGTTRRLLEGEIIVAPSMAWRCAARYGQTVGQELMTYVIHGLLHLLGWRDHTRRAQQQMWRKQTQLLKQLGL